MPYHIVRTPTASLPALTVAKGLRTTRWVTPPSSLTVHEIQHQNPRAYADRSPAENTLVPPYHWHWYQDENFCIKKGNYIFTLEGVDTKYSAASAPQPITIPARARHTFRCDPETTEECLVEITATATGKGMDEEFFRNIYAYLDDCEQQKVAPSLPQLLLFLHHSEISLAFPGPTWLAHPASWLFGLVIGKWFGGYVLGYEASYSEYYNPKMNKDK